MRNILNACRNVAAGNWAVLAIALVCLASVAAAAEFMAGQRQSYQDAAGEAAQCRDMARQILTSRGAAPAAASLVPSGGDDSAEIGSAANAAGIVADNLDRIEHDGLEREGSSPYVRRETGISLKGVSLLQTVDFLVNLESSPAPLVAQSLRITPTDPSAKQDNELWDIALSVVSIRYVPATGQRMATWSPAGRSEFP